MAAEHYSSPPPLVAVDPFAIAPVAMVYAWLAELRSSHTQENWELGILDLYVEDPDEWGKPC